MIWDMIEWEKKNAFGISLLVDDEDLQSLPKLIWD